MASETDTSTARRSDPSTVSAAALRLDPLLRKIRDGISQYLEAFALAIQGARRQDIKWPLFVVVVPDPGDGGTIVPVQQEAGDFVGIASFGLCELNIPVSEADIETAARYLQHCGLDPDAQRLLEVFKELKSAFRSVGEYIPISDASMANRKFYAQDRALMLSEHLEDLIRTLPTILTRCEAGQSRPAPAPEPEPLAESEPPVYMLKEFGRKQLAAELFKRIWDGKKHTYEDLAHVWDDIPSDDAIRKRVDDVAGVVARNSKWNLKLVKLSRAVMLERPDEFRT